MKYLIENTAIYTTPKVLQACLELEFLFSSLLPGVKVTTDINEALLCRNLVYLEYDLDLNLSLAVKNAGKRLIIFHLGDETCAKDLSAYTHADHIFRNYYHKQVFEDIRFKNKLSWSPNGYRNGLAKLEFEQTRPTTERRQLSRFIGWLSNPKAINNERKDFEACIKACNDLIQCIPTQGFAGGFSAHLYKQLMVETIFAPCPAGNAAETIRLFDVLELGCIPITTRHHFLEVADCLPDPPFSFIQDWQSLPGHLQRLNRLAKHEPEQVLQLQERCINYWEATKSITREKIRRSLA